MEIDNGRLHYQQFGSGTPLLLIAGLGGVGGFWRSQVDCLAQHFCVVTHDLRGAGGSETSSADSSIRLMADDTLRLMDHLGLERAALVGHSTGGVIAQTIAAFSPERVSSLVLSSSWAKGDAYFNNLFRLRLDMLHTAGVEAYERFGRIVRYPPWYFERHPEALDVAGSSESGSVDVIAGRIEALLGFDSSNFLDRIVARTLIIGARDDAITPAYLWKPLHDGIEGSVLVELDTGGHFCPQTQAETYNMRLIEFLLAARDRA